MKLRYDTIEDIIRLDAAPLPVISLQPMSHRRYPRHPITKLFWGTLALTAGVWVLRGLSLLAFIPGIVLWILILLCFSLGIISSLQRMR